MAQVPLSVALAGHYSFWEGSLKILLLPLPIFWAPEEQIRQDAEGQELLGPLANLKGNWAPPGCTLPQFP